MKNIYYSVLLLIAGLFVSVGFVSAVTLVSLDGSILPAPAQFRSEGCQNAALAEGAIKVTTYYSSCFYSYDLRGANLSTYGDFTLTYRAKHSADSQYNFTNLILVGDKGDKIALRGYSPATYRMDLMGEFGQSYENVDQTAYHIYSVVSANQTFSFYIDGNLQSTWKNPLVPAEQQKWQELQFGTLGAGSAQLASIWFDSIELTTPTVSTPAPTAAPTAAPTDAPLSTPVPTPVPGDATGDRVVNEADYLAWYNSYTQSPDTASAADFDKNGVVDGFDYVIWLENTAVASAPPVAQP